MEQQKKPSVAENIRNTLGTHWEHIGNTAAASQQNKPKQKSVFNKERYEQNKEEILKYRRERYRCVPNVFLVCS
jgi:hypothetical protein